MTLKAWDTEDQALQFMQNWDSEPESHPGPQMGLSPILKWWSGREKTTGQNVDSTRKFTISKYATKENIFNTLYRQLVVINLLSYKSVVQIYNDRLVGETSSWDKHQTAWCEAGDTICH